MSQNNSQATAGRAAPKVGRTEVDNVRSYMFEAVEAKDVLHVDRLGADDIARVIEKLAEMSAADMKQMWVWVGGEEALTLRLTDHWRVKIMRDGAVVIKVTDYALIADSEYLLLRVDEDGWFIPIARGREITWEGTEEYFSPSELLRLAREVAKRVLEQTRWL
jgi:hypothetical protein